MITTRPVLLNAAGDLAATSSDKADSWWFAAKLHEDENAFWVQIHTMEMRGECPSTVSLFQESGGHVSEKHTVESLHDVKLSADRLNVQTSILTVNGDLDEFEVSGETDTASVRLTLRREEPVLYNGGAGVFPFFGGTTGQYSLPGLATSGTITADETTHHVSGRTWFDRQWIAGATERPHFTWLGLDLGAGRYLSVWDTAGDGTSWLTALESDGSHLITHAQRTDHNGHWILTVPSLDASLEITHHRLAGTPGSYTGACSVTGALAGKEVSGHGYTDIIG